ncbi:MAG TPA: amino acid permease [Thermomicrobiales bacterium]|nr:amino acid permease [Thermomicrobiales bacterium]
MRNDVRSRRSLGFWMATALVVGNMIGSGIFLLPSALAPFGGISLLGWVFTAGGAILLALVFARLARAYPQTGGPYAYSRLAFGDFVGFQTAWGYWINVWVGNAAIAVAFAGYLAVFWPAIGTNPVLGALTALGAIWLLTGVNALGIRTGGWVQAATTVVKMVPLVAIALFGVFHVQGANFQPFNASGQSPFAAVTAVAALTLWAFIGLESATVPADDVADPDRTIPRATLLGTGLAALVYILCTFAVIGVVPRAQLAGSTAPFSDAARVIFGGWAGPVVAIGALVSTFGCLNGWILLQGQVPLAAARDGVFPTSFMRANRAGAPVVGLVVSSLLATILVATNYTRGLVELFTFAILLATLATLLPYAYAAMSEVMLLATDRARFRIRSLTIDVAIALLAFAYALWAIAGAGADVVLKGTLLFLAGIPVYVAVKWRAAAVARATQPVPGPSLGAHLTTPVAEPW